ncbi:adenylate/guanylate cyclase domain-containing protein [Amaricoccus tamworthensis]|uniref:adenylate/guanylate cyclase domain-containing protein n=1 Tax=Amaricoccus tamworthensis TaxID=57002 RepID=UPI003C7B461C
MAESCACVLIADITGSTGLYERLGNERAVEVIDRLLARMQEIVRAREGHCVSTKGDDVLSFFPHAGHALEAALGMIEAAGDGELGIHAGMYHGEFVHLDGDIYGNAVNTAARLAAMAKPGEILLGDRCFADLCEVARGRVTPLGRLQLRGKEGRTEVWSHFSTGPGDQTEIEPGAAALVAGASRHVVITHGSAEFRVGDGEILTIGRSEECMLVVGNAGVSRRHGVVSVTGGLVEYTDHSSTGSLMRTHDGQEIAIHRRTTMLNGRGILQIGKAPGGPAGLLYRVVGLSDTEAGDTTPARVDV